MRKILTRIPLAASAFGLAVLAFAPAMTAHTAPAVPVDAAQLAAGEKAFAQCKACHSIAPGAKDGVGPNLFGFYGTKAGAHSATYKYSAALKGSGLTWNDKTLDTFLLAPMKTVPGTKMTYGGVKDDTKRKALIYYLKTKSSQ